MRKEKTRPCNKKYSQTHGCAFGLFHVGCGHGVTQGWEMMRRKESPRNFFRLLTTRNINIAELKAVCYDNACLLSDYVLNREAKEFQHIKFIVDTVHWANHSACSRGFNSKLYKDSLPFNSQNREQANSLLARLKPSLRQMSYSTYMVMIRRFFHMNNLKKNKILK